jgi:hypothetical protein
MDPAPAFVVREAGVGEDRAEQAGGQRRIHPY